MAKGSLRWAKTLQRIYKVHFTLEAVVGLLFLGFFSLVVAKKLQTDWINLAGS